MRPGGKTWRCRIGTIRACGGDSNERTARRQSGDWPTHCRATPPGSLLRDPSAGNRTLGGRFPHANRPHVLPRFVTHALNRFCSSSHLSTVPSPRIVSVIDLSVLWDNESNVCINHVCIQCDIELTLSNWSYALPDRGLRTGKVQW